MHHKIAISTGHSVPSPGVLAFNGTPEHVYNTVLVEKLLKYHVPHGEWFRADHDCEDLRYPKHLRQTIANINANQCTCAIEIHHNATKKHDAVGSLILYADGSDDGYLLARKIADSFTSNLREMAVHPNIKYLGKKNRKVFLWDTDCPAVIIEPAFIDNLADLTWLELNQTGIASAIFEGLLNFLTTL